MYAEAAGICGNGHELLQTGVPISVSSYHHPIYIQKSPFYLSAHKSSSLMTPWCGFTMYAEAAGICGNGHELFNQSIKVLITSKSTFLCSIYKISLF